MNFFFGFLAILSGLDLPSIKYLRKKGLKSIQWKKLFKEADFRNKYFVLFGVIMLFFACLFFILAVIRLIVG